MDTSRKRQIVKDFLTGNCISGAAYRGKDMGTLIRQRMILLRTKALPTLKMVGHMRMAAKIQTHFIHLMVGILIGIGSKMVIQSTGKKQMEGRPSMILVL